MKDDFLYSQIIEEKDKSAFVVQFSFSYLDTCVDISRHIRVWITIIVTKLDSMLLVSMIVWEDSQYLTWLLHADPEGYRIQDIQ